MAKSDSFQQVLTVTEGKPVELPDGKFLANASFAKDGHDLLLSTLDGTTVKIEEYFNHETVPDLVSADGAFVPAAMVDAFLLPEHAGMYAEAGSSMSDVSPAGQITEVIGDATIVHADGTKSAAAVGISVFPGDVVETSADGAVNILFADNTTFAISESARLSVDEFIYSASDQSGSSMFSMMQGVFVYTSGLIGKNDPGNVNIETPVGSIGIRGTVVAGDINPAGQDSQITIVDGAIVVTNGAGSVELDQSFETASLSSYQQEPQNIGVMDAQTFSISYQAAAGVAKDTFSVLGVGQQQPEESNNAQQTSEGQKSDDAADGQEQQADAPADTNTQTQEAPLQQEPLLLQPENQDQLLKDGQRDGLIDGDKQILAGDNVLPPAPPPPGGSITNTPVVGSDGTNAPIIGAPRIFFNFSNDYTKGTASTIDDGVSPFAHNWASNVIGHIALNNPPPAGSFSLHVTGFDANGDMYGNTLRYDTSSGNLYDTNVTSGTPILHFDAATSSIQIVDKFALLANLQASGNLNFSVVLKDIGGNVIATQDFVIKLTAMPGLNISQIFIGDPLDISAPNAENPSNFDPDVAGSGTIIGTVGNDLIYGRDDNDTIISAGGEDYIFGGNGNDTIALNGPAFKIVDGGNGTDTLRLSGTAQTYDFTTIPNEKVRNIEILEVSPGNVLKLNLQDIFDMSTLVGNDRTLTVKTINGSTANLYIDLDTLPDPSSGTESPGSVSVSGNLTYVISNYAGTGTNLTLIIDQGGATDGIVVHDL